MGVGCWFDAVGWGGMERDGVGWVRMGGWCGLGSGAMAVFCCFSVGQCIHRIFFLGRGRVGRSEGKDGASVL